MSLHLIDGFKAFGTLLCSLVLVPFWPLRRVIEVTNAIVGGAYLYAGELWAPFIPRRGATPGSRISRQVLAWITGLRSARLERCRGWVELRELDVAAESMAVRAIDDAIKHGGLLKKAITQLVLNFQMAGRQAKSTWVGHLLPCIRKTWPQFRILVAPTLEMRGLPPPLPDVKIGRQYTSAAWAANWRRRQLKLMKRAPCSSQQDFILYKIIFKLGHLETNADNEGHPSFKPISEAIFPTPTVGIETFRCMLRVFSGMGDFARVNAHRPRWQSLPGIRDFEHGNRICLFCWVHAKHRIVDSEWHAFFACPTCSGPRRRFRLALSDACRRADIVETPLAIFDEQQWRIPLSCDLVRLVILCRKDYRLVDELARFCVEVLSCRQRAFKKLTVRDLFPD